MVIIIIIYRIRRFRRCCRMQYCQKKFSIHLHELKESFADASEEIQPVSISLLLHLFHPPLLLLLATQSDR